MKPWKWVIALLPAVLGITLAVVLNNFVLPVNPVVTVRGQVTAWLVIFSLLVSLLTAAGLVFTEIRTATTGKVQAEAAEERRRFLSRLDHELKNPLTAIRAGLANVAEAPTEPARREAMESIQAQALRLSRLAGDLRKLAELETRTLEKSPVNLDQLLCEVFDLAQDRPEAGARRLALSLPQAPWPLSTISGDPDLLFLAVHNLVDNAIKFTPPGSTVEIRAFEDGSMVVVEVADTGPGIPPEELPHVWEELYRGKSARGIPGSGLGLALVRAIVDRHGGRISLRSRPGQGTVVSMRLPLN